MNRNEQKKAVGLAALEYIEPGSIIGVGTGSTVNHFIDALGSIKNYIIGAVSSSIASTNKLSSIGIPIIDCNSVDELSIYVDGADEVNFHKQMIKGGGTALTREKIIAAVAIKFICIVDSSKEVEVLGKFPLPIEVIPMARSLITRELIKLGGTPRYRKNVFTDNGHQIIDVYNLNIIDAIALENKINSIPGVVTVGLFANRVADIVLVADVSREFKVRVMQ